MNIHEYQAKQLFSSYGINVLKGDIAFNVNDAVKIAQGIDSKKWVVKAQIHAGGGAGVGACTACRSRRGRGHKRGKRYRE